MALIIGHFYFVMHGRQHHHAFRTARFFVDIRYHYHSFGTNAVNELCGFCFSFYDQPEFLGNPFSV